MMDFLRRLAPPRDGDRSRAVAVLPSRFASEAPLRSMPSDAVTADEDAPVGPVAMPRAAHAEPGRPMSAFAAPPSLRKALDPSTIVAMPPVSSAVPERPTAAREPMQSARAVQRSVMAGAPVSALLRDLAPGVTEPPRRVPAEPAPTSPARARPTIPPPAHPLSPQAVAARTSAPEPPRPVIHVTIDHIEVRAPAAPARPPAPTKPRAPTPSVSLADYLRGGRR